MLRKHYWVYAPRPSPRPWAILIELMPDFESMFPLIYTAFIFWEGYETGQREIHDGYITDACRDAAYLWQIMREDITVDRQDYNAIYLTLNQIMKESGLL